MKCWGLNDDAQVFLLYLKLIWRLFLCAMNLLELMMDFGAARRRHLGNFSIFARRCCWIEQRSGVDLVGRCTFVCLIWCFPIDSDTLEILVSVFFCCQYFAMLMPTFQSLTDEFCLILSIAVSFLCRDEYRSSKMLGIKQEWPGVDDLFCRWFAHYPFYAL